MKQMINFNGMEQKFLKKLSLLKTKHLSPFSKLAKISDMIPHTSMWAFLHVRTPKVHMHAMLQKKLSLWLASKPSSR